MATYPDDATSLFTTSTFTDMSDKKPDKGYSTTQQFSTIIFESEAGYEKRRLRSRRSKTGMSLTYTNVTGLEKYAIESFYKARSGEFESFTLAKEHVGESGTLTVRFDGDIKITHILSTGANLLNNHYTVSFDLKEVFS